MPCALWMVRANPVLIGNCRRWRYASSNNFTLRVSLVISTSPSTPSNCTTSFSTIDFGSSDCRTICLTIPIAPFTSPFAVLMFFLSIIRTPSLKMRLFSRSAVFRESPNLSIFKTASTARLLSAFVLPSTSSTASTLIAPGKSFFMTVALKDSIMFLLGNRQTVVGNRFCRLR